MTTARNDPDSEENQAAMLDNERAVFAAQMQARISTPITCLLTFSTGETCYLDGAADGLLHLTDADTPYGSGLTVPAANVTPDSILLALRAVHARFEANAGPDIAASILGQLTEGQRRYRETITRE